MSARRRLRALAFAAALLGAPALAQAQETHLAVIVGLAGEPEHAELFQRWAGTLVDAAGKLGVSDVIYLAEKPEVDAKRVTGKSTKEEVVKAFDKLAAAGEDDVVFIVLIGHGSFDGKVAKFNLPGPDLTPADFEPLLKKMKSRHVVFVNTASASGPFLADLSGPNRTIVTATRNGAEQYATLFGGFFIDALTSEAADSDKNKRVSVLEAFRYAKAEVAKAYEREGLLSTEHALLDDNGDKEGSPEPSPMAKDGKLAASLSIGSAADALPLPADPKLRALYLERRDMERRVEALRLLKDSMEPAKYASELEKLVTDLALKTREIRTAEQK